MAIAQLCSVSWANFWSSAQSGSHMARITEMNTPRNPVTAPSEPQTRLIQAGRSRDMRSVQLGIFVSTTRREHTSYCRISDDVEQILWEFGRSDPYNAVSYDTLHWDDGEKFGRHLWVYTKQVLKDLGKTNEFNKCMAEFPRWRGLDHFTAATAIDFTEGNAFLALLECIVPCVVHLLPRNSPLVNALRALQQFRIMVGMDCTLESRLQIMDSFGYDYEKACREVTRHYNRTNGRDAEHQMVVIDGNEEAMARLDMIVADAEACENQKSEDTDDDVEDTVEPARSLTAHWRLSAPDNRMTSRRFETEMSRTAGGEAFNGFDMALQQFLSHHYPEQVITFEEIIMSMVDWAPQRDIMRCSPQFYGRPRYDCVLYNAESDPLSLARLVGLLPCTIPGNWTFDLAFVYRFKNSKWMPRTIWKGCRGSTSLMSKSVVLGQMPCGDPGDVGAGHSPDNAEARGGDSRPTKTASGWGWGVNKDDGQEGPRADNGDERVGPGAGNGDGWVELCADKDTTTWGRMRAGQRTKMRPYGDPGDMGAGCSPDNGDERVGLRADKGDGRLGSRVKKGDERMGLRADKADGRVESSPNKDGVHKARRHFAKH
ncbi:hypothetical protein B0H14DRAFT_2640427 [Mycena olivaceomarginata]|nr:hypothetical protein B0H14DRAFT_2640427 [Mycena olivaceomarginata]